MLKPACFVIDREQTGMCSITRTGTLTSDGRRKEVVARRGDVDFRRSHCKAKSHNCRDHSHADIPYGHRIEHWC